MGGWRGFTSGRGWLWGALLATTFATQASAETRSRLSESVSLFGEGPSAAAMPMSVVCTPSKCAAFYVDNPAGFRLGAVLLDAAGAPIEATRVDLGHSYGDLRIVAAGESFVIGFIYASGFKALQLDSSTLGVTRDLSAAEAGDVRAMYSDGKSVLLLDFTTRDIATTIDLASGAVIGKATIPDFWEPLVIPGPDQYLLFYPTFGSLGRISSLTGAWLGQGSLVGADEVEPNGVSGYFRDGTYQLAWRYWKPAAGTDVSQLYGTRVSAADGNVIDTDGAGRPQPRLLCSDCPNPIKGTFQIGDANYFWFEPANGAQTVLKLNPATGLRSDPSLTAADVSLADSPVIYQLSPSVEPRLLHADYSVYTANTEAPAQLIAGEPHLPGQTSGVKPMEPQAVSNGESFLVAWNDDHVLRASLVSAEPKPALAIAKVTSQDLGLPAVDQFQIASAQGKYLIAGTHVNDDRSVDLAWRVMDASGALGSLITESTTTVASQTIRVALGSDGDRYLLALADGSLLASGAPILAQRISAEGAAQEAMTELVSSGGLLFGVHANFASPESERRFVVMFGAREGNILQRYLSTVSSSGALAVETSALNASSPALANDGHSLLLSSGALLDLNQVPLTSRVVPREDLPGVSHWNGNTYVRLTTLETRLTVNEVNPETFKADGEELQVTAESVRGFAAAAADAHGRSLIAYFASEAPSHVVALRAALLETETDPLIGEGGAGGEGGTSSSDAGMGGELSIGGKRANLAGAVNGGGSAGAVNGGGSAAAGNGSAQPEGGAAADRSDSDRLSRACGCALPGLSPGNSGFAALALLAITFARRRRQRIASRRA